MMDILLMIGLFSMGFLFGDVYAHDKVMNEAFARQCAHYDGKTHSLQWNEVKP